jgi:hypothetical protein
MADDDATDLFLIQPEVWFAVLCEEANIDAEKRIDLRRVFNRWYIDRPPGALGIPPNAHVRAILAIGVSAGVGEFAGTIEIQDVDGRVLFATEGAVWKFAMGPGEAMGSTMLAQLEYWFRETGNYFYVVRLEPGGQEIRVRLEIADRPVPDTPVSPP